MVLVCHSPAVVFLKTHKTAGTSTEMFLEATLTGAEVEERTHTRVSDSLIVGTRRIRRAERRAEDDIWVAHMPASDVRARIGDAAFAQSLKVANIRDPFDLAISWVTWFHLAEFKALPEADQTARRRLFEQKLRDSDFSRIRDVVFDEGQFVPDVLIRYETLADELRDLCRRLGIDFDTQRLPWTKDLRVARGMMSVADFYTEETCEIVRAKLDWLFEHGGYPPVPGHVATQTRDRVQS